MNRLQIARAAKVRGFSLLELMIVLVILSLIAGAVFSQMGQAQTRLAAEETKLDDFGQARDFVDQFFRDANQIGNPNIRMFDTTQTFSPALTQQVSGCAATPSSCTYSWANPYINDNRFAMGLTYINQNEIHFEGSVNGTGTVQSVIYKINGSGSCTLCMQRSQIDKISGDPLTGQNSANWGTEVNDVQTTPVFRYFQYDGTEITTTSLPCGLPADYTTQACAQALANVKTIQINLTIRNPNIIDLRTGLAIETSFEGEVSLNNCSMAASGQNVSCQ
jgi:prepilin-type N-terminal cleavage/methylation domain-containing protein